MIALELLDKITPAKTTNKLTEALLSLEFQNPRTGRWSKFEDINEQDYAQIPMWQAQIGPQANYPLHAYGGHPLFQQKQSPSGWKKAKKWMLRYGPWIAGIIGAGALGVYGHRQYMKGKIPLLKPHPEKIKDILLSLPPEQRASVKKITQLQNLSMKDAKNLRDAMKGKHGADLRDLIGWAYAKHQETVSQGADIGAETYPET